jgi:prepilin-type N-terminal cleavage/methylation domain-containing protein
MRTGKNSYGRLTAEDKPAKGAASGFTLIEMAVVLVIVGIVISMIATVLPSLIQSTRIRKAQAVMEKLDLALQGYSAATGRLPCPDINGDGEEDRDDSGTRTTPADDTCSRYSGELPYRTLGLPSGHDPWQSPVAYAVYEDLITTTPSTGSNDVCIPWRRSFAITTPSPATTASTPPN